MAYLGFSVVILLFLASVSKLHYLWGLNNWSYFGVPLVIAFAGAGVLLLNKKTFNKFELFLEKSKIETKQISIILISALILFIVFSQSTFFLGDGYLRIRNTEDLQYFSSGSPLGNYFTILIYDKIAKPNGFSALSVWRLISYLSGISSILIFYFLGRRIFDNTKKFILAGLLIFITPLSQMYFGYVESYPLYYTFLLAYYLSTIYMLRSNQFSISPAIWIIFAFFISPTAVLFSPAILYSYYTVTLNREISHKSLTKFFTPIATVIFITILVALFLYSMGFTPEYYTDGLTKVDHFLGLFPTQSDQGIFDITHLNDIINQIFLVVPGFGMLIFVKWKQAVYESKSSIIFLAISAFFALLFMLLFRTDISFVRDWDLLSMIAYPLIFIIIVTSINATNEDYNLYTAIVLALIQFVPWILLNSNEKLSLNRMVSISSIKYLPDYAKSNNYDILRQYYQNGINVQNPSNYVLNEVTKEKLEKSLIYASLAYNYEKNERYLYNLSLYSYILKQKDSAIKYLNLLFESKSNSKYLGYTLRSKIYIDDGKIKLAIEDLKKVEEYFPKSETVKLDIANLYYIAGEPRNAYEYFQKAYAINPDADGTLDYLIELSYLVDSRDKTVEYYHKYDKLKPDNPATYYNIALCFTELNNKDSVNYYSQKAKQKGISEELLNKLKFAK